MAAYTKFSATYNNRAATSVTRKARKVLSHKAFRASLTLAPPRDRGAGDAVLRGQLPLGLGLAAPQAVAPLDDVRLPLRQALPHQPAQAPVGVPGVQVLQHGVLHPHHVQQEEALPVLVRLQRVRQGHLPLQLPLGAEVHQDLIFDAPGGVGGQPRPLGGVVAGDPLDEADGADGDQIVLVRALGVILFGRVKRKE